MKLNDYLDSQNITKTEFSRRANTTLATISRISDGLMMPRKELLERIYKETGGMVTPNDIAGLYEMPDGKCRKETKSE